MSAYKIDIFGGWIIVEIWAHADYQSISINNAVMISKWLNALIETTIN